MQSSTLLLLLASLLSASASPAPLPSAATTSPPATSPVATVQPGFTGVPPPSVNPANCQNIDLAGETRNDLLTGPCKPFTLIFARGTSENGNIGAVVGPPFVDALVAMLGPGNVAVQGVNNYPADVNGFNAGGSATGSQNAASLIATAMQKCPTTKLCVSGYSQGAQVIHNAANMITAAQSNFINSVVLFGDPDDGQPVGQVAASKVSVDCHLGDDICLHGNVILPPHLDYCLDATTEATFAVQKSGLKSRKD